MLVPDKGNDRVMMERLSLLASSLTVLAFAAACAPSEQRLVSIESRQAATEAQVADLQTAQQNIIARLVQVRQELDNSLQPLRTQSADRGENLRSMEREITALEAEMVEIDTRIVRLTEQYAAGGGPASETASTGTAMPPPRGARAPSALAPSGAQQSAATTLYNSAYNDYLRENWELCVQGFEEYARRYQSSDRADNARYWIGMCERERGQLSAAHTAFQSVVRDHPNSDLIPDAMLNDGLILKEEGRERAAAESFRRLIQAYADSDAAFLACGQLRELGLQRPGTCEQ